MQPTLYTVGVCGMAIGLTDQLEIQTLLARISVPRREALREEALGVLAQARELSRRRTFSAEDRHTIHIAIELLVRLEALECGGGSLFRAWRRMRLVHQYFSPRTA
jgi:hypothetical protein